MEVNETDQSTRFTRGHGLGFTWLLITLVVLVLWWLASDAKGVFGPSSFFVQVISMLFCLTGGVVTGGVAVVMKHPGRWWLLAATLAWFVGAVNALVAWGEATGAV